jgi:hypothetical protein
MSSDGMSEDDSPLPIDHPNAPASKKLKTLSIVSTVWDVQGNHAEKDVTSRERPNDYTTPESA